MGTSMKFKAGIVAAATVAVVVCATDASAAPRCRAPVEGAATATGILGAGTAKARIEARRNWEDTARNLYGPRYGRFWAAQGVQWDCKKGAILLAKCVVIGRPCRY